MRKGNQPMKGAYCPRPPTATLGIVTHYQDTKYHAGRMPVVRKCLDTMLAGAQGTDYELIIFDNGSTPAFREMLREYNPTVLIESINIGQNNARRAIGALARGAVLCLTDDDFLFHPDWLALQLQVLNTYPNVGSVSGSPQKNAFKIGNSTDYHFSARAEDCTVTTGQLIPAEWERDYCQSIGADYRTHSESMKSQQDLLLNYHRVKAWAHGHHAQMMGRTEIIRKCLFETNVMLSPGRKYSEILDGLGYLTLTTHQRTAIHIGNVLDERILKIEMEWQG